MPSVYLVDFVLSRNLDVSNVGRLGIYEKRKVEISAPFFLYTAS